MTLGIFSLQPALTFAADIVADASAPEAQRPYVTETANGIPLVQIARPDGSDVSVNHYEAFSVPERGAILNNAFLFSNTACRIYRGESESQRRTRTHHRERGHERPSLGATRLPRSGGHKSRRRHCKSEWDLRRWCRLFEYLSCHSCRRPHGTRCRRRLCGASYRGRSGIHHGQGA